MALLLPFLVTMLVGTLDVCRLFYAYTILSDCAINGAAYLADPSNSPYTDVTTASLADASNLSPRPAVSSSGPAFGVVVVKVTYTFNMLTTFLGSSPITISRQVQMAAAPVP